MKSKTYWSARRDFERSKIEQIPGNKIEISGNYEIMSYPAERKGNKIYIVIAFRGKAGKPFHNYYYTKEDRFFEALEKLRKNGIEEIGRKKKRRKERKGKLTEHALVAKIIRQKLKYKYPEIKFSVRSESFAGGDAVRISWENGPTVDQINKITGVYLDGYYNGMEDYYQYCKTQAIDENGKLTTMPGVKYITTNRIVTDDIYNKLIEKIKKHFAIENDQQAWEKFRTDLRNYAYRIIQKVSLIDITIEDLLKLDNIYNLEQNNIYNQ